MSGRRLTLTPDGVELAYRHGIFPMADERTGEVIEVRCTYDPATRGGDAPDKRRVKSTIHWVSAQHAVDAEVRIYDNLFTKENLADVEDDKDVLDYYALAPGDRVRFRRVDRAEFDDIAARVGYSELSAFSRAARRCPI